MNPTKLARKLIAVILFVMSAYYCFFDDLVFGIQIQTLAVGWDILAEVGQND